MALIITATGTTAMASDCWGRPVNVSTPARGLLPRPVALLAVCALGVTNAFAGNWTIVPRISGSETYTDNVTEAHSNTQSDLITEISPGININGAGKRLKLNMDYQMQSLFFAANSHRDHTHQNLAANGQAELLEDLFFVDGMASISQQLISAQQRVSLDNFTASSNRTDVRTYSLSPYLRHDFSGYVNGTLRYTHDVVDYSNTTVVDNSEANSVQAALASGRHSGRLGWNLNYNDQRIQRDNPINDATYKDMDGEVRYLLTPKLSAVVQGGREENEYRSSQPIVNGNYWAAGLDWVPNHYIKLRGLDGSRYKTAGVTLTPNVRTELTATYRNREVGRNPGPAWSGNLTHRTINTVLEAGYLVDTVTAQQLAQERLTLLGSHTNPNTGQISYVYQDSNGNFLIALSPDLTGISTLTNEVIARKRATAAVHYHRRKSTWRFDIFDEQRVYQFTQNEERGRGAHISWGLQLTPRSQTLVTVGTQRSRFTTGSQQSDFYFIQAGLMHELSRDVSGGLDYRFFNQDSNGISNDYRENRLMARLTVRF